MRYFCYNHSLHNIPKYEYDVHETKLCLFICRFKSRNPGRCFLGECPCYENFCE